MNKFLIIYKDLIRICGKVELAMLLTYFMSQPEAKDENFLLEEKENKKYYFNQKHFGWQKRRVKQIQEGSMLIDKNKSTVCRYINTLIEKGWLNVRIPKEFKLEREYRVNISVLVSDMNKEGLECMPFWKGDDWIEYSEKRGKKELVL